MPAAYSALLQEVVRRRAYRQVFEARVAAAAEEAAALRSCEIVARDRFLREHLVSLPVMFVEAVPALTRMPPQFDPSIGDEVSVLYSIYPYLLFIPL
jgi:hypothetical protein